MGCSTSQSKNEEPLLDVVETLIQKSFLMASVRKNPTLGSLLSTWSDEEIRQLTKRMKLSILQENEIIVERGKPSRGLYLLHLGTLRVESDRNSIPSKVLPGQFIGERSVLLNIPIPNTVTAAACAKVFFVPKDDFNFILHSAKRRMKLEADEKAREDLKASKFSTPASVGIGEHSIAATTAADEHTTATGRKESIVNVKSVTLTKAPLSVSQQAAIINSLTRIVPSTPSIRLSDPLPSVYVHLKAKEKLKIIWRRLSADCYDVDELPNEVSPLAAIGLLNPIYLSRTFLTAADELLDGRKKMYNTYGAAVKVQFKANTSHDFTGLFRTGASGVMRLSLSNSPQSPADAFEPCIALKLFIDKQPSVNIFAVSSRSSRGTYVDKNFFSYELATSRVNPHVSDLVSVLLPSTYSFDSLESTCCLLAASMNVTGDEISPRAVHSPRRIVLIPTQEAQQGVAASSVCVDDHDFRLTMTNIQKDTILYTVSVVNEISAGNSNSGSSSSNSTSSGRSVSAVVGTIVAKSKVLSSKYADEHLFFQHHSARRHAWRPADLTPEQEDAVAELRSTAKLKRRRRAGGGDSAGEVDECDSNDDNASSIYSADSSPVRFDSRTQIGGGELKLKRDSGADSRLTIRTGCGNVLPLVSYDEARLGCQLLPSREARVVDYSEDDTHTGLICAQWRPRLVAVTVRPTPLTALINPLQHDYLKLPAENKQALLWDRISRRPYPMTALPNEISLLAGIKMLNPFYVSKTFTHAFDEVVEGRKKIFNTYGAAAKVLFKAIPTPPTLAKPSKKNDIIAYSGLFKTGAVGIIRFSLAKPVFYAEDPYRPAIALKLFIDGDSSVNGKPSVNLFASGLPEGQFDHSDPFKKIVDRNFFSNNMSTSPGGPGHTSKVSLKLLPQRNRPSSWEMLPLQKAASITSSGARIGPSAVVTPSAVIFTPDSEIGKLIDNSKDDFRAQLAEIPIGTVLYNVLARSAIRMEPRHIGYIVLDSRIVASKYGDEHLFFQHPLT